ncbi:hypothetical protein LXT12_26595 [Pelomonas sp. P7]|uniref:Immunity MXAN-0049 protein domain-containing protein n=1 Tax=Pelomonas caseinilytica TaxID=2906763 RepID=A0ABS8XIW4_9BURK|nr:hypothetical protein [Pelomonas sp. P7]MCE4540799.1 hypothetical protein [Pelomonas sp. P7]
MMPIYSLWPAVGFKSIYFDDDAHLEAMRQLNVRRLASGWRNIPAKALSLDAGRKSDFPSVAVLNTGGLAVEESFRRAVFEGISAELEFLPITVEARPWFIVNCLSSVAGIDEPNSKLMRSIDGEIYMAVKLTINANAELIAPLFTLTGSNRAQIFCTQDFKNRVLKSGARGLRFDQIGEIAIGT